MVFVRIDNNKGALFTAAIMSWLPSKSELFLCEHISSHLTSTARFFYVGSGSNGKNKYDYDDGDFGDVVNKNVQ